MACSMNCCAGKSECCCNKAAHSSVDVQKQGKVTVSKCSCKENIPQPLGEGTAFNILLNEPSLKQNNLVCLSINTVFEPAGIFSAPVEYPLLKSYHGPAVLTPLRI